MTDVASQGPAASEADRAVLTNRQGHPVYDNQNQRTVGARGPATLENYQFLEPISTYTRAKLFSEKGKQTELAVRFSTVAGGRDFSEMARDPRGFAVKMY